MSTDIFPDDELLRRFSWSERRESGGPNSGAFYIRTNRGERGMSVYNRRLTDEYQAHDLGAPLDGVSAFPAHVPLNLGLDVKPDPIPEARGHALVIGHFTKSIKRALADASIELIAPSPGPAAAD